MCNMLTLSKQEYEALIAPAKAISDDARGEKVFQLTDGRILKLFRTRRLISSSTFYPYAKRFAHAAKKLRELQIATVTVDKLYRIAHLRRDAVVYHRLPGTALRAMLAQTERRSTLLPMFAQFVALLHARGVYFRAIHFGNVLVLPDGNFGLIDLSQARFRRHSLTPQLRARNFKPMLRYTEDRDALDSLGVGEFIEHYLDHAHLNSNETKRFNAALQRHCRHSVPGQA